jgi:hypothetical protein
MLYDNDLAAAETHLGRPQITGPAITARYALRLELLHQATITGASCRTMPQVASELPLAAGSRGHPHLTGSAWPTDHARELITHGDGYQDDSIPARGIGTARASATRPPNANEHGSATAKTASH